MRTYPDWFRVIQISIGAGILGVHFGWSIGLACVLLAIALAPDRQMS